MTDSPITIFVHGTIPPKALLALPFLKRFFRCPKGLTPLSDLPTSHSKDMLTLLSSMYPNQFHAQQCYTFGWSGLLKHTARLEAAQDLYTCLDTLRQKHPKAPITLITHSHGGNVALCLPQVAHSAFQIHQLILLACPVQKETAQAVDSNLFNEVYSFHSHHDLLQVADPQGAHALIESLTQRGFEFSWQELTNMGPLFSERHFPADSAAKQLNIRYPLRELFHIEFLLPQFMKELPNLIDKLRNHTKTGTDKDDLIHVFNED